MTNTLLIDGFSNANKEGVTIHFNERTALHRGGLATNEWRVSWDKIGKALCGKKYCSIEAQDVKTLDIMRATKTI